MPIVGSLPYKMKIQYDGPTQDGIPITFEIHINVWLAPINRVGIGTDGAFNTCQVYIYIGRVVTIMT